MDNIVLLFGGDSCERDISIITAVQLYENIDRAKHKVYPVFLLESEMYYINNMSIDTFLTMDRRKLKKCRMENKKLKINIALWCYKTINIDAVVLATHGGLGENGGLQGYLEMLNIPYTSPSMLASSILMDKVCTKHVLYSQNIPFIDYVVIRNNDNINYVDIVKKLSLPLIVKPASLGSSIGIRVVEDIDALINAVELAFYYDNKVVIERALVGFREYNIALYRCCNKIITSEIESPRVGHEMLKFDDKYMSSGKMNGGYREFPAIIDNSLREDMVKYAKIIYETLDMKGVVRFDYLLDGDKLYLNEVNTIPGSMAYYLFESKGISYKDLIDDIIDEAVTSYESNGKLIRYYQSSVLKTAKYAANKLRK